MTQLASNVPNVNIKFLDGNGNITTPWLMFLMQLYQRTGGNFTPSLTLTQLQEFLTSLSVTTANGFAGYVNVVNEAPVVTIETTVNGMAKGNGLTLSAATAGVDYAAPTSGTSILYGDGNGGFSNVTIGANLTFASGTLSASGGGGSSALALAFAARHG